MAQEIRQRTRVSSVTMPYLGGGGWWTTTWSFQPIKQGYPDRWIMNHISDASFRLLIPPALQSGKQEAGERLCLQFNKGKETEFEVQGVKGREGAAGPVTIHTPRTRLTVTNKTTQKDWHTVTKISRQLVPVVRQYRTHTYTPLMLRHDTTFE